MRSVSAGPGCLGILYEPQFRRIDHLFNHVNLVFGSFYQDFSVLTTMFRICSITCGKQIALNLCNLWLVRVFSHRLTLIPLILSTSY